MAFAALEHLLAESVKSFHIVMPDQKYPIAFAMGTSALV
jgi:hypothetical protein